MFGTTNGHTDKFCGLVGIDSETFFACITIVTLASSRRRVKVSRSRELWLLPVVGEEKAIDSTVIDWLAVKDAAFVHNYVRTAF